MPRGLSTLQQQTLGLATAIAEQIDDRLHPSQQMPDDFWQQHQSQLQHRLPPVATTAPHIRTAIIVQFICGRQPVDYVYRACGTVQRTGPAIGPAVQNEHYRQSNWQQNSGRFSAADRQVANTARRCMQRLLDRRLLQAVIIQRPDQQPDRPRLMSDACRISDAGRTIGQQFAAAYRDRDWTSILQRSPNAHRQTQRGIEIDLRWMTRTAAESAADSWSRCPALNSIISRQMT